MIIFIGVLQGISPGTKIVFVIQITFRNVILINFIIRELSIYLLGMDHHFSIKCTDDNLILQPSST